MLLDISGKAFDNPSAVDFPKPSFILGITSVLRMPTKASISCDTPLTLSAPCNLPNILSFANKSVSLEVLFFKSSVFSLTYLPASFIFLPAETDTFAASAAAFTIRSNSSCVILPSARSCFACTCCCFKFFSISTASLYSLTALLNVSIATMRSFRVVSLSSEPIYDLSSLISSTVFSCVSIGAFVKSLVFVYACN